MSLQEEVDLLEKRLEALEQGSLDDITYGNINTAKFNALYSIVMELAEHSGISTQEFLVHYEKRFRFWHQRSLQTTEDVSPSLAAATDTRTIAESVPVDSYPPLFP